MSHKSKFLGSLAGLGLLLGVATGATAMPVQTTPTQFRRIEQPLGIKIGVTVGGLSLMGLELWWFLLSQTQVKSTQARQGIQEMTITVDGGYEPSRVVVNSGQPVRLNFLRKDPNSCLEQVLLPDFHIAQNLELNEVTPVEFTPEKPGRYPFTCGINMFRGWVEVQASKSGNFS